MKNVIISITILYLVGCSVLRIAPIRTIEQLPVITVGSAPPQTGEYIVYYPAGFDFPVRLDTSGSLFASEDGVEYKAALAKDLYLYKYWASHDGKVWKNSHELLKVEFGGGFDINGMQSNIKLNSK